jgi:hypothetical protein
MAVLIEGAFGTSHMGYGHAGRCNHQQDEGLPLTQAKHIMMIRLLPKSMCIIENTMMYTEREKRHKF